MLESSAVVFVIIALGKYIEKRAKSNILAMTQEFFPQEKLLKHTELTYIEPKDRNLNIEKKQNYEISLLDKEDII